MNILFIYLFIYYVEGVRRPLARARSLKGREGFSSAWEAITVEDDETEERP